MKRFATTLCAALIALFALGPLPVGADDTAIDVLERTRAQMKELAEEDLPDMDVGKQTQDKEEAIIQELDALINMILDYQARQDTGPCPRGESDDSLAPNDAVRRPGKVDEGNPDNNPDNGDRKIEGDGTLDPNNVRYRPGEVDRVDREIEGDFDGPPRRLIDTDPSKIDDKIIEYYTYRTRKGSDKSLNKEARHGEVNGNIFDDCKPEHSFKDEWGQPLHRDFHKTPCGADVPAIPGYEKLVMQYRAVKSARQNTVDR